MVTTTSMHHSLRDANVSETRDLNMTVNLSVIDLSKDEIINPMKIMMPTSITMVTDLSEINDLENSRAHIIEKNKSNEIKRKSNKRKNNKNDVK